MKDVFVKAFLGVAILLYAVIGVYADETLKYELTPEKVKEAWMAEIDRDDFFVVVELKEPYRKEFSELTGDNIGKRLEIIVSGRIFSGAVIRARIESGRIRSNKLSSEEDAKRIMEVLKKDNDDKEVQAIKGVEELAGDKDIVWARTFGGEKSDAATSVRQTFDGGYIITGGTSSYGSGKSDVYLIKTDSTGNEEWSKTFGGEMGEVANSVQQISDGGYIIAGITETIKGSDIDVYLVKTDSSGNEEWSKTFGGKMWDQAFSVQQASDGGYIITGSTSSRWSGLTDFFLLKTDSSGNEEWSKTFGGEKSEGAGSVQQTTDGGYIVAGSIDSYGSGSSNVLLLKTDSSGNEEWSKTFGGKKTDNAFSVQQTTDGGYVIAGYTESYGAGQSDFYLIKTDPSGNEEWSKTFGGKKNDAAMAVQQTTDGGYIVTGYAGYAFSKETVSADIYLIKTDSSGKEEWSKTIGGKMYDNASSIQQTKDSGYIIAGVTQSYGSGSSDVLLIKLAPMPKKKPEQK